MKQKNKLLFALMGATLLSANALAETQAPSLVAYDVNGDGTIAEGEKAYELKSADDLYWFANYVNDMANAEYKNWNYQSSANAVLTANITVNENLLSRLVKDNDGNVTNGDDFKAWSLIGYFISFDDKVYYAGTFDGNGHTISGLYFNDSNREGAGLIGLTTEGAVIKNVGVIDSYFKGKYNVGGVCGANNKGTIENCYNTGKVSGGNESSEIGGVCGNNGNGTIKNCYNTGEVSGGNESFRIGGVCGCNGYGTIKNCYNTGEVSGGVNSEYIGGVCGDNDGAIENCYNTGKVSGGDGNYNIGGVCGNNGNGTIKNCYNSGEVSGGDESSKIGGVCGYNGYGTIENCYYLDSSASVGIGYDVTGEGEATAQTAEEFANGTVAQSLRDGTNDNVWGQYIGVDKSPKLTGVFCPKQIAEGDYAGYYAISNADELYWFAGLVNGKLVNIAQNKSANAVLTDDITVNDDLLESLAFDEDGNVTNGADFGEWSLIGYYNSDVDCVDYAGTFDGNGHTISGLYFNNSSAICVGLFGSIYGATIKNVGVIDSYFKGSYHIGGVCGYNEGGTIENCYNSGEVSGDKFVAGVCGYNEGGTIENCYNTGEVSGGVGSYCIGGVCGYNGYGTITNCYNTGEVSGGVNSEDIGGVCGYNDGTITNCYDFKLNGGTINGYSIVVDNNKITLPAEENISLDGFNLEGWHANEDLTDDAITSEAEFSDVHTLYAKWVENSTPTAIKAVEAESNKTIKTIKDGQIVIIRNGVMYDMQGRKL